MIFKEILFNLRRAPGRVIIAANNKETPTLIPYKIFELILVNVNPVIFILSNPASLPDFVCGMHGTEIKENANLILEEYSEWYKYK